MLRMRDLRVSVRLKTETKESSWKIPLKRFTHARYQRLIVLRPMSVDNMAAMSRTERNADWIALARQRPAIPDGARLVTIDADGNDETHYDVVKSQPMKRVQQLFLLEVGAVQS